MTALVIFTILPWRQAMLRQLWPIWTDRHQHPRPEWQNCNLKLPSRYAIGTDKFADTAYRDFSNHSFVPGALAKGCPHFLPFVTIVEAGMAGLLGAARIFGVIKISNSCLSARRTVRRNKRPISGIAASLGVFVRALFLSS